MTSRLRKISADFARTESGGAALETTLLLGLGAAFAFTVKHLVAGPLLSQFTRAARTLSQALGS